MESMNTFTVIGTVTGVEERISKRGSRYSIMWVHGGDDAVPVAVFRTPPHEGETVRVTGRLGSSPQGFLQIQGVVVEVVVNGDHGTASRPEESVVTDHNAASPNSLTYRGGGPPPGGSSSTPVTNGFSDGDDGGLPF